MASRLRPRYLDCSKMTLAEAEQFGEELAPLQRDIMFWLGDLARFAEAKWPETWHQAFPAWISPGLLARTAGVCRAYPTEADRQHNCTYSQYMQVAGKPDRQALLAEMEGKTTDETRNYTKEGSRHEGSPSTDGRESHDAGGSSGPEVSEATNASTSGPAAKRWLLAVDVNYHLTRVWSSGAGVEAAMTVAQWIRRTAERMQKDLGLTDLICCVDSKESFRRELVEASGWEDGYKPRATKDPEHATQLQLIVELLEAEGFRCIQQDGMEADDLMASYAKQFDGRVTLLTVDKDMRQCLSATCNMLIDIEWTEDETSGQAMPDYKWVTAKSHTEGMTYSGTNVVGIRPDQWVDFQCLAGDSTDGISGAVGIGAKIASDLIKEFGTAEAAIAAAKEDDPRITAAKRKALIEFEGRAELTRKLVTLRDDLTISNETRLK